MADPAPAAPAFQIQSSRHFAAFLAAQRASLAFSTYQSGKLFLLGLKPTGELAVFERTFNRCMGLWADGQTLWMSTACQLWRFENALAPGEIDNGFDRLYVPRTGHTTGDLDVHDVAVDADGRVVFVNTLFSCLATVSERPASRRCGGRRSSRALAAEDRCHLNGLALEDGRPRYVTAVGAHATWPTAGASAAATAASSSTWTRRGRSWPGCRCRTRRAASRAGCGCSTPAPATSGPSTSQRGAFEPIAFCPGYLRGLAFVGDYAVVGLSQAARRHVPRPGAGRAPGGARRRGSLRPAGRSTCRRRRRPLAAPGGRRSRSCTTWSCCPASCGRRRWASRPTRSATRSRSRASAPSGGRRDRSRRSRATVKPAERLYAKAWRSLAEGQVELALDTAQRLVERAPRYAAGHALLGAIHQQRRDWASAVASHREAASLAPDDPAMLNNLGLALRESGDAAAAAQVAARGRAAAARLRDRPQQPGAGAAATAATGRELWRASARALARESRLRESPPQPWQRAPPRGRAAPRASRSCARPCASTRSTPKRGTAWAPRSTRTARMRDAEELAAARAPHPAALPEGAPEPGAPARRPRAPRTTRSPGTGRRWRSSPATSRRSWASRPSCSGRAARRPRWRRPTRRSRGRPASAEAHVQRAGVLRAAGRLAEALASFERALALDPDLLSARAGRLELRSEQCDWRERDEDVAVLRAASRDALARGDVPPLIGLARPTASCRCTAEEQLALARAASARIAARLAPLPRVARLRALSRATRAPARGLPLLRLPQQRGGPPDAGALSQPRPLAHRGLRLLVRPRRRHALPPPRRGGGRALRGRGQPGPRARRRAASRPTASTCWSTWSAAPATAGWRSWRCVPPRSRSTSSAIRRRSDARSSTTSSPTRSPCRPEPRRFFDEAVLRLPDSYQLNDDRQEIARASPSRADCGLPADAFVFACFNATYKIDPRVFDAWMRVLGRVPGSVLWLLETAPAERRPTFAREAAARGIDPARLVFARLVDKPLHLARHRLARPLPRHADLQRAHDRERCALGRAAGPHDARRDLRIARGREPARPRRACRSWSRRTSTRTSGPRYGWPTIRPRWRA